MKMNTRSLVTLALLIALVVILANTPIGYLNIGVISITLLCLPVIIGTLTLGILPGMIIGLAFAVTSFMLVTTDPFAGYIMVNDGIWVLLPAIFLPRILIPTTVHYTAQLLNKAPRPIRYGIAAAVGSLTNTVFFLGLLYLLWATGFISGFLGDPDVLPFFLGIVGTNGVPEAIAAAIICPPILIALDKVTHKLSGPKGSVK